MKKAQSLLALTLLLTGITAIGNGNAYGYEGGGGDSGGVDANCSNNAYTELCGSPAGSRGGGASWRVFKVEGGAWGLDSNTSYGGSILQASYKSQALTKCKQEGWFISFGWDGMYGSKAGYSNFNFQIGPANRTGGQVINQAKYNTYNLMSYNELVNNNFPNNTRISSSTALTLYQKMPGHQNATSIPTSVGYFCYSPSHTVTVDVKDNYTQNVIKENIHSKTVTSGSTTTISGKTSIDGYYFYAWGSSCKTPDNSAQTCTTGKITRDTTIYVHYRQKYSITAKAIDTNGNSLAGVTGLNDKTSGLVWKGNKASVERNTTNAGYTFKGWRTSKTGAIVGTGATYTVNAITQNVTVYAVYEPFSATSTLDLKIKNENVAAYKDFTTNRIYARPDNKLTYQIVYQPNAQGGRSLKPQKINIDNSGAKGNNNTSKTLEGLFNSYKGSSLGNWNNALIANGPVEQTYKYNIGDTAKKTETMTYNVAGKDVGESSLKETVELQHNSGGATPAKVEIGLNGGQSIANVSTVLSKNVEAYVPYNFINATCIIEDGDCIGNGESERIVPAGETKSLNIGIEVKTRDNNTLSPSKPYATIVKNAQWKIGLRYGDNPNYEWTQTRGGDLNTTYNIKGETMKDRGSITVNIPDLNAGSKVCFVSAVYPKDSHDDLNTKSNLYGVNDINSWAVSPEVCYIVAKKPNIQIWGGNVYANGLINTSVATKTHLSGYNNYSPESTNDPYIFGSWGELGVISTSIVEGFASGASTGYVANNGETLTPNPFGTNDSSIEPGGSKITSFCKRIPLTIFNSPCKGISTVGVGSTASANATNSNKAAIIAKYLYGGEPNVSDGDLILDNAAGEIKNDNVRYYHSNTLTIAGGTTAPGETKVVHAKNITISSDLTYEGTYNNLDQMPKLVIYAENDIDISCGVNRIDALLVAEGNVKTCSDSEGIDDVKNSNQLTINL